MTSQGFRIPNKKTQLAPRKRSPKTGKSSSVPSARAYTNHSTVPHVNQKDGIVRVSHSEMAGVVTMNFSGFDLTPLSISTPGYDINPRCSALFPWLSNIAANYEQYKFTSLSFKLVSSQPSIASGRIYVAVDYDYDDTIPSSAPALMANKAAVDGSVWQQTVLTTSAADLHRDCEWKYVLAPKRSDPEPRTVYGGFLLIGGQGMTSDCTFDLWVSYTCEFRTPQNDDDVFFNPTLVPIAVANVTAPDGAGRFKGSPVIRESPVSVPVVIPGAPGVPVTYNGTVPITSMWDIARTTLKTLSGHVKFTETGVTPANVLLKNPDLRIRLFDAAGTGLGELLGSDDKLLFNKPGPLTQTLINTASAELGTKFNVYLDSLRKTYPNVKYLAPIIDSVAGIGAGTFAAGFQGYY